MIARLISQMGLSPKEVVDPALMVNMDKDRPGVFHVPQAKDSPYVPAQDFVRSSGIKSVLGFGDLLHSGDLFAVIMFSKIVIPRATAEFFNTLALITKLAVGPFGNDKVFTHLPYQLGSPSPHLAIHGSTNIKKSRRGEESRRAETSRCNKRLEARVRIELLSVLQTLK